MFIPFMMYADIRDILFNYYLLQIRHFNIQLAIYYEINYISLNIVKILFVYVRIYYYIY